MRASYRQKSIASVGIVLLAMVGWLSFPHHPASVGKGKPPAQAAALKDSVNLSDQQARQVQVITAATHAFAASIDAVGYVDFNQDRLAQIFSPYQGRVLAVEARAGDDVRKGQTLFTVESPDLAQAESALISNAALSALSSKILERSRQLLEAQANAQKDLDQASSDQQTTQGNYRASRNAMKIFGKSDTAIDHIITTRKVDNVLTVSSPFDGHVTARAVTVGSLVQPGAAVAAFSVADLSSVWVVAYISENDIADVHKGLPVEVNVAALPQLKLKGIISYIGTAADAVTHRVSVRAQVDDPSHQLRPQMLATFVVHSATPTVSIAVPLNAVVREGDGSITVFTTRGGHRFYRREVQLGLQQNGVDQIIGGLSPGEMLAGDGALFISNALALQSQ